MIISHLHVPVTILIMAWRCSGTTNVALITNLAESGLIRSDRVKQAMLSVSILNAQTPDLELGWFGRKANH